VLGCGISIILATYSAADVEEKAALRQFQRRVDIVGRDNWESGHGVGPAIV
jgi:hypothetical protein